MDIKRYDRKLDGKEILFNYSFNDLKIMYDELFLDFINKLPFEKKFLNISDLDIYNKKIEKGIWDGIDPFIREYRSKHINLALDILKNGTYCPIVVIDKNIVREGCHRISSFRKMLINKDIYMYSLLVDNKNIIGKHGYQYELPINGVCVNIPINKLLKVRYPFLYDRLIKRKSKSKNGLYEVKVKTDWEIYKVYQFYTTFLRDLIYLHRIKGDNLQCHNFLILKKKKAFSKA